MLTTKQIRNAVLTAMRTLEFSDTDAGEPRELDEEDFQLIAATVVEQLPAISDQLPAGFRVDLDASDHQYLYLDHPERGYTLSIKNDDEGVVVDLFPFAVADQPLATLHTLYADINEANDKEG